MLIRRWDAHPEAMLRNQAGMTLVLIPTHARSGATG
jgi:hypothetical protein